MVLEWPDCKWQTIGIYCFEMLGYLLMAYATMREELFNRGLFYMIGSFMISIAKELVIVKLLVPKNQIN